MTIGATLVADYPDVLAADAVSGGPIVQEEPRCGAGATVAYFERSNKKFQRKFRLTKEWPDNKQSAAWYMTDAHALCGVFDVLFTHMDYSGGETTWKVASAKVEISVKEPIGVTTESEITVTGGLPVIQP